MSEMFSAKPFDSTRVSDDSSESKSTQQVKCTRTSEKSDYYEVGQAAAEVESICSGIGFFHPEDELGLATSHDQIYQQQQFKEFSYLDDLYVDVLSPPFQSCEDEIRKIIGIESQNTELTKPKKRQSYMFPHESFEVLRKYRSRSLISDKMSATCYEMQPSHGRGSMSSSEVIINMAAQEFTQSMSERSTEPSLLNYPSPILALSEEDSEGVQLVQNLLYCAMEVAEEQYERAIMFLKECHGMSSRSGTPIQRLVFYFSEALAEKISEDTGRTTAKDLEKKSADPQELMKCLNMIVIAHEQLPLSQITTLVGAQTILHHLEDARKVHIIDLEIRSGIQWVQLMQDHAAQSEHPIQHLKITAVGTKPKSVLEETGRQLASFAQSIKLRFTFKIVQVEDIFDLNENLFDLDADESVAVYAAYTLSTMTGRVDRLDHLMKVIRNLSPRVMVVTEMEANFNSPTFIGRSVERLFFFGAFFDSLADCLKNQETCRMDIESLWLGSFIRNVLAAEGDKRTMRYVNIHAWRAFFAPFGLVELELRMSSLNQANLMLQSFSYGSSFTLYRNGGCLIIGWKGTPLMSLSAWKAQQD